MAGCGAKGKVCYIEQQREGTTLPKDLLEELADSLHCTYLSDLHRADLRTLLPDAVARIPASAHPLQEWNDAVLYLSEGGAEPFDDPEQARAFLQQPPSPPLQTQ